jgi:glycosyltransferase involved in cell wall biosynthesis
LVLKNAADDIIRALARLPKDTVLAILGDGPDRAMLEELAASEGAGNRVRFLGTVAHAELPAYLQAADVFIRPSLSEGMGNSFIEAMAAGVPVIATLVGGIPDFLKDGETGLACEVRNPASIAAAVTRFRENAELRARIVTAARKLVTEKYDWNDIAKSMGEVFVRVEDR